MRLFGVRFATLAWLFAFATSFLLSGAYAGATGTALIRQSDGHTDQYNHVKIKLLHGALFMTTADGKGTVVIHRAACSYQAQLMVCFVTSATLIQGGSVKTIDLKTGTIYANTTDDPQPMPFTTRKVAPHSILLSLSTYKGTYVSLVGRVDKVVN
jgi:hypothetical protein